MLNDTEQSVFRKPKAETPAETLFNRHGIKVDDRTSKLMNFLESVGKRLYVHYGYENAEQMVEEYLCHNTGGGKVQ